MFEEEIKEIDKCILNLTIQELAITRKSSSHVNYSSTTPLVSIISMLDKYSRGLKDVKDVQ